MESLAAFPGEWDSLNRMFSTEELDLTQQFLHHHLSSFPPVLEHDVGLGFVNQSTFCPNYVNINDDQSNLLYSSNIALIDSNFQYYNSQESSQSSDSSGTVFVPPPNHETYFLNQIAVTNDITNMSLLDIPPAAFPNIAMEDHHSTVNDVTEAANGVLAANELLLKRKFDELELHAQGDHRINTNSSENTKKRTRVSKDAPKKNRKINLNGGSNDQGDQSNNNIIGSDGQSSSSCCSDDDNVSQSDSKPPPALNLNGKTRASRGSATDPQSLYARKRRERINERLRILQNLVPNGTKVDISTMLEEAVHYVKFLQLQIKLLSSDDLWMFAPIAYNGVDVGLNQKISTLL